MDNHLDLPLEAVAYTLNTGRSHFGYRFTTVVSSRDELQTTLKNVLRGQAVNHALFSESAQKGKREPIFEEILDRLQKELSGQIEAADYRKKLLVLADLYVKGYDIDWNALHQGEAHQRINLPSYPFLKKSYWVPEKTTIPKASFTQLHPLVDSNVSTLNEQCFKSTLTGNEFYLADHIVGGQKILPGVVYLEMALAAGNLALPGKKVSGLQDVIWAQPLIVEDATVAVNIHLEPQAEKSPIHDFYSI